MEKCSYNPAWTCIHPHPFDPFRPPSPRGPRPGTHVSGQVGGAPCEAKPIFGEGSNKAGDSAEIDIDNEVIICSPVVVLNDDIVPAHAIPDDGASLSVEAVADIATTAADAEGDQQTQPHTPRPPRAEDSALAVGGPLWTYLDRAAQYDGSIRDLYELYGPYK
jgi:hypothetical protein